MIRVPGDPRVPGEIFWSLDAGARSVLAAVAVWDRGLLRCAGEPLASVADRACPRRRGHRCAPLARAAARPPRRREPHGDEDTRLLRRTKTRKGVQGPYPGAVRCR